MHFNLMCEFKTTSSEAVLGKNGGRCFAIVVLGIRDLLAEAVAPTMNKSIAKPDLTSNRIRWNEISINARVLWRPLRESDLSFRTFISVFQGCQELSISMSWIFANRWDWKFQASKVITEF
jgi:hypothetical protein